MITKEIDLFTHTFDTIDCGLIDLYRERGYTIVVNADRQRIYVSLDPDEYDDNGEFILGD